MSFLEAIFLGLVQGLTEFIPVSSTAHIVIVAHLFGVSTPGLVFEIFLHMASLLAVIIYFWRDLLGLVVGSFRCLPALVQAGERIAYVQGLLRGDLASLAIPGTTVEDRAAFRFSFLIVLATGLTGVLGILLTKGLGDLIKAPPVVAGALLLTGILLILVERLGKSPAGGRDSTRLSLRDGILVGLAQTLAIVPGISRSGATLIAGLSLGLSRETAVRFSFLLAVPVLIGTSVLGIKDISGGELADIGSGVLAVAFIVSFLASMVSIVFLISLLKKQRLYWFSIYLFLLAGFTLLFL